MSLSTVPASLSPCRVVRLKVLPPDPAGHLIVSEIRYVPFGRKMIARRAGWSSIARWIAAVQSAFPSPTAL